jgi:hypothetical protein
MTITKTNVIRWLLVALASLIMAGWMLDDPAAGNPTDFAIDSEPPFVDEVTVIDCIASGRGPGTLVIVPVGPAADGVEYAIEVDTANGTQVARRTMLVLEGETFRVTADGQTIKTGTGHAAGSEFCDGPGEPTTTTQTPPTTTVVPTTTQPPVICDDVCEPPTTTTQPPVPTTTIPGQRDEDGNCPPGTHDAGANQCLANAEGG